MAESRFTKDTITGVFSVALGSVYLISTTTIPLNEAGDEVGPRAFPYIIAFLVILCGLWLLGKEFLNRNRQPFSWEFVADRAVWVRIVLTMAAGICYGLVLDWLGYLIATFLFMMAVCELLNVGRHVQNAFIAAAFSVSTFVSFALLLKLSLPRGILGAVLPF